MNKSTLESDIDMVGDGGPDCPFAHPELALELARTLKSCGLEKTLAELLLSSRDMYSLCRGELYRGLFVPAHPLHSWAGFLGEHSMGNFRAVRALRFAFPSAVLGIRIKKDAHAKLLKELVGRLRWLERLEIDLGDAFHDDPIIELPDLPPTLRMLSIKSTSPTPKLDGILGPLDITIATNPRLIWSYAGPLPDLSSYPNAALRLKHMDLYHFGSHALPLAMHSLQRNGLLPALASLRSIRITASPPDLACLLPVLANSSNIEQWSIGYTSIHPDLSEFPELASKLVAASFGDPPSALARDRMLLKMHPHSLAVEADELDPAFVWWIRHEPALQDLAIAVPRFLTAATIPPVLDHFFTALPDIHLKLSIRTIHNGTDPALAISHALEKHPGRFEVLEHVRTACGWQLAGRRWTVKQGGVVRMQVVSVGEL